MLLKDTNNEAIYASITEGGHGVPSALAISKKLNETRLLNIESMGDEDDGEALARSTFISKIMRPMYLHKYNTEFNENIYSHHDTKGLRGIGTVPSGSCEGDTRLCTYARETSKKRLQCVNQM